MTVLDVFPDSHRPDLVQLQRQDTAQEEVQIRKRLFMQEVEECVEGGGRAHQRNGVPSSSAPMRQSTPTEITKQKTERSPIRSRRKSRWKLKFHHQALPPEYLKHYKQQEKKRRQSETKKVNPTKNKTRKITRKGVGEESSQLRPMRDDAGSRTVPGGVQGPANGHVMGEGTTQRLKSIDESFNFDKQPLLQAPRADAGIRCKLSEELLSPSLKNISKLSIGLDITQNKAFLENLLTNQIEINRVDQNDVTTNLLSTFTQANKPKSVRHEEKHKRQPIPSSGKILNYSDLPYMGEITLDGIKPRRGRKPKKADICHLIYKNYGQVFPGAPSTSQQLSETTRQKKWKSEPSSTKSKVFNSSLLTKASEPCCERQVESPLPSVSGLINHTEVQNRIINSLLERRLTQEMRQKSENVLAKSCRDTAHEEPLNLCIRDLKSLKIKLSRKHGNYYETKNKEEEVEVKTEEPDIEDEIKKEVASTERTDSEIGSSCEDEDADLAPFNLVTTELRESSDEDSFISFNDQITLTKVKPPAMHTPREEIPAPIQLPLVPWPAGLPPFVHPSPLLYYDRLPSDMALPPPLPFMAHHKAILDKKVHKTTKARVEGSRQAAKRIAPKVISNTAQVIAKRKRSAIFIPPVPSENPTNPTTEVSICKFKFTGGAKPSLQEKKMLSVDSGGNFRYYSGTGDKSMRGYEYFPRESLQQCQENTGCSPSGVFLTASALGSGEKIPEDIGHSGFFDTDFPLQLNDVRTTPKSKSGKRPERLPTSSNIKSESEDTTILPEDERNSSENSAEGFDLRRIIREREESSPKRKRSRKTRKSLARERLEQTFKEKGFLIQTQQLESAEGATYCKFRQLRKFTRYLFRSWKDYLPGNVRDLSVDAGVERDDMAALMELPSVPSVNLEEKPIS